MSEISLTPKKKGGRRIVYKLKVLQTKEGSASTYVRLEGLIAIPNVLLEKLTKKELFIFLQSREIVGKSSILDEGMLS